MRYELTDEEWTATKPNVARQAARRSTMNDGCLTGIFWVVQDSAPSSSFANKLTKAMNSRARSGSSLMKPWAWDFGGQTQLPKTSS